HVQLPDRPVDEPAYVRTGAAQAAATPKEQPVEAAPAPERTDAAAALGLKPIDTSVRSLQIAETSDTSVRTVEPVESEPVSAPAGPSARVYLAEALAEMKAGDRITVPVMVDAAGVFRSAVLGIKFDEKQIAVRSVSFGEIFGTALSRAAATPFLNQSGRMFVTLAHPDGAVESRTGILAFVEIEALA